MRLYQHAIAIAAYLGLFVAHGQRKFFIIPAVLYAARYLHVRSLAKFLAGAVACGIGLMLFMYLGFLRTAHAGVSQGINPNMVGKFADGGTERFGGETIPVFATASAAYEGFVRALPFGGDYWQCWMMSVPHALWHNNRFEPLNERFAHIYLPSSRVTGMGWGFSFFGEAFLVGGYPVVVVATLAMMLFFRKLYLAGGGDYRGGVLGAISLSAVPFAFWFQRNSLAYLIKEFVITQIGIILIAYFFASVALLRSRRGSTRSPSAGIESGGRVADHNPFSPSRPAIAIEQFK